MERVEHSGRGLGGARASVILGSGLLSCSGDYWYLYIIDNGVPAPLGSWYCDDDYWQQNSYSLSAYAGHTIRLEFRFTSDSSSDYWATGFFVDDV